MTTVITHNELRGFHCWPNAPDAKNFLRCRHRHIFVIECEFEVTDDDREVEIFTREEEIETILHAEFGVMMELGTLSCEMLAKRIMARYPSCVSCTIREDGKGGARVTK